MVRQCLNYTHNDPKNPCDGSYSQCAKSIECPEETEGCFGVFTREENNQLAVFSAGCTFHKEMPESCSSDCLGKNRTRFFYCCCNQNNCNENLIIPQAIVAPQTTNYSNNNFTTNSTQTITGETNWFAIITLILLITSLVSAFFIRRRRRLTKEQSNNSDVENALRSISSNDGGHSNKTNKVGEVNEMRSIQDVALMLPICNILGQTSGSHNPVANTSQQLSDDNSQAFITSKTNPKKDDSSTNPCDHTIHQSYIRVDLTRIKLLEIIGSGRFGTVHKATVSMPRQDINNDSNNNQDNNQAENQEETYEIAIKVTSSSEYQSWQNELKIYSSFKTRHPNILSFLGSCQHVSSSSYWLLVEYASKGSLHHYLKDHTIYWHEFLCISLGIVHGLSHLHDADIAHRDFKSKNVLLKRDLTPCITDFGVAAMLDVTSGSHTEQRKKYLQVGTPRYMAPEVLECSVTFTKISFTKIDVYALSLVLWELLSRCYPLPWPQQYENDESLTTNMNGQEDQPLMPPPPPLYREDTSPNPGFSPYKMPFEDVVGSNPDISTMRKIVTNEKLRPPLRPEWHYYPVSKLCQAIIDGWEYDHDARISASCFVERIESLQQQLQQQKNQRQQNFHLQQQHPPPVV